MKAIHPLGNRIVVKRSQKQTTKGGIIIPDTAKEKPKEGEVVAVGPGKRNEKGEVEPMSLKKGDRVLFSSYSGTEVKNDLSDEELIIMSEDEVLGILI